LNGWNLQGARSLTVKEQMQKRNARRVVAVDQRDEVLKIANCKRVRTRTKASSSVSFLGVCVFQKRRCSFSLSLSLLVSLATGC